MNESQSDPNKYEDDCRNDRVVFTKTDHCAVTSKFFDQYYKSGSLKGSLIWLGACDSIRDNRLADVLLNKGASTVIGNDNPAFIPRLIYMTNEFFDNLLDGHDAGTALKLAKAQIDIKELGDAFSFANGGDLKITQLVLRGSDTWKLVIGASITVDISNCLNLGSIYAEAGRTGSAIASGISRSYNDNSNVDITITNCGNGGEISAKHVKLPVMQWLLHCLRNTAVCPDMLPKSTITIPIKTIFLSSPATPCSPCGPTF